MGGLKPIDLSKVPYRVLWSKEKIAKEEEERKAQAEKAKREKKKKAIKSLANIVDGKVNKAVFKLKDVLSSEFKNKPDKQIKYIQEANYKFDLGDNVTGRLYPSKADIVFQRAIIQHNRTREILEKHLKDVKIPQFRDFFTEQEKMYKDIKKLEEIKKAKQSKQNNTNLYGIDTDNLHVIDEDIMELSVDLDSKQSQNPTLSESLQIYYPSPLTT